MYGLTLARPSPLTTIPLAGRSTGRLARRSRSTRATSARGRTRTSVAATRRRKNPSRSPPSARRSSPRRNAAPPPARPLLRETRTPRLRHAPGSRTRSPAMTVAAAASSASPTLAATPTPKRTRSRPRRSREAIAEAPCRAAEQRLPRTRSWLLCFRVPCTAIAKPTGTAEHWLLRFGEGWGVSTMDEKGWRFNGASGRVVPASRVT